MNPAQPHSRAPAPACAAARLASQASRRWRALPSAVASALALIMAGGAPVSALANGSPAASLTAQADRTTSAPAAPPASGPAARVLPPVRPADRLVPKDCLYTNSTAHSVAQPEVYQSLVRRYGEGWTHMHHYCNALRQFIEYNRFGTSQPRRNELSWRIIGELDYVIRWSPTDFALLPMVMLKRVEYLMHFGRAREGIEGLADMIEMFPKQAEAHARLAWYLRRAGRQAEAEAVLSRAREMVADPAELDAAVQRLAGLN
jgi:hypothetical protein